MRAQWPAQPPAFLYSASCDYCNKAMKSSSIDLFWDSSIIVVQGRKNQIFTDQRVALFPLIPSTLTFLDLIKSMLGLIKLLYYWDVVWCPIVVRYYLLLWDVQNSTLSHLAFDPKKIANSGLNGAILAKLYMEVNSGTLRNQLAVEESCGGHCALIVSRHFC